MSTQLVAVLCGVAALVILIPIAIHQRRGVANGLQASVNGSPPIGVPPIGVPLIGHPAPPAPLYAKLGRQPLSVGGAALAVFLGLWMFAISAAVFALLAWAAIGHQLPR